MIGDRLRIPYRLTAIVTAEAPAGTSFTAGFFHRNWRDLEVGSIEQGEQVGPVTYVDRTTPRHGLDAQDEIELMLWRWRNGDPAQKAPTAAEMARAISLLVRREENR